MADLGATSFAIDQSLALASDGYTADLAASALVRSATLPETVTLGAGLRNRATGVVDAVGQMEARIDRLTLRKAGDSVRASVRGRDQLALLLERPFRKLYLRQRPEVGSEPTTPYAVGLFTAQEVAREVVEAAGLTLSWQCRDYRLLADFEAVGRSIDVLAKLVEPWCQVEALKVDIFAQGSTVFCRPRVLAMTPDFTYTIQGARISDFEIDVERGPIYGTVTLSGRQVPRYGYGVQQPAAPEEEEEPPPPGVPIVPWELTTARCAESRDAHRTTARVLTETTYRMPDQLVLRIVETTLQRDGEAASSPLRIVSERETVNEWEDSVYNDQGRTNNPRQLRQVVNLYGIHKNDPDKFWRHLATEETTYGRDEAGYREITTTVKKELNLSRRIMECTEKVVRTLREKDYLKVEQVTTTYKPVSGSRNFGDQDTIDWYAAHTDTQEQAGLRPEGPPPPPQPERVQDPASHTGGAQGAMEAIALEETISTDPRAVDVRYSNPHLAEEDLAFILDQFRAVSGLWHYVIRLTGVAMPWLRKGNVLHLTGLLAEDGVTEIPLQPALITEAKLTYNESGNPPAMLRTMTLEYWGPLWPA
ncbi:MAG: hypothetical protein ACE147_00685 [Candidatus Methylomirabilales bacterium]